MTNDLMSEMAADGTSDQLDRLGSSDLKGVADLANRAAEAQRNIEETEEILNRQKKDLYKITDQMLPEALEALGLERYTLTDGSEISLHKIYSATIAKDRVAKAHAWLRDHGHGDLIKNTCSVAFGKGEDEKAAEFLALCGSNDLAVEQREKVEPSTLKAWVKERTEAGEPIPNDTFGVYISARAKIKRKGAK